MQINKKAKFEGDRKKNPLKAGWSSNQGTWCL